MTCQRTTDARQVLSRNTEFACIENDIPLRTAIFVHQSNELMKKFVRTTAALNLFMGEKAVYFVVYIKQETLQVIARYLVAETMIGIGINSRRSMQETVYGGGKFGRKCITGLLFYKMKKEGSKRIQASRNISICEAKKETRKSSLFSSRLITAPGRSTTWVFTVISYFFRSMAIVPRPARQ